MPISLITHAYKASYKISYNAPYQASYKGLLCALVVTALLIVSSQVSAKAGAPAPTRQADEGQGPYKRLILRGVNLVSGEGAPTRGPVDIVIENDIITNIVSVGHPGVPIKPIGRPKTDAVTKEMDLQGIMSYLGLSTCMDILAVRRMIYRLNTSLSYGLPTGSLQCVNRAVLMG